MAGYTAFQQVLGSKRLPLTLVGPQKPPHQQAFLCNAKQPRALVGAFVAQILERTCLTRVAYISIDRISGRDCNPAELADAVPDVFSYFEIVFDFIRQL